MDPVSVAAVGWAISTAGWIISPIVAKLVNSVCPRITLNVPKKIRDLETCTLPRLALTLGALEISQRHELEKLVKELKSAFYQVEDILDDAEYCRLEKQLARSKKRKFPLDFNDVGSSYQVGSPNLCFHQFKSIYSLRTRKESRLEQRHGLQNTTLTLYFL
jgi:hypothetical protein